MSDAFQPNLDFSAADNIDEGEAFVVDLDGFEGPLHVLLALARTQKVDLLKLSITRLAEQYLAFVHEARRRNFALAADYLVMASWLAYLKSRLLLPKPEKKGDDEVPAEVMAQALAFRLMKLEAMRKAVEALTSGPVLNRDVFGRGDPEAIQVIPSNRLDANLYDLMAAYVSQRRREAERHYNPTQRVEAFALEEARDWMLKQLPRLTAWTELSAITPQGREDGEGPSGASYLASTLSASLELVKEGRLSARQLEAFDPLFVKTRRDALVLESGGMIKFAPDEAEIERRVEALLFAAAGPLTLAEIARRLPEGADAGQAIAALRARFAGRGVELVCVADRWAFRTAQDLSFMMTEQREEPRKLSKAALETLAIIAYHQPTTRAEIESVRGVGLSKGTLDLLLELGMVRLRGRRRSPGRPVTYGTTEHFLEHFGLAHLADLPGAADMRAAGLLDLSLPADFMTPDPSRAGDEDLDPIEEGDDTPEFAQDFMTEDEA